MVNTVELDIFTSEEFVDKNATLPTVIVLNDNHCCGYFIPVSTMAKCGWIDFDEHQLVSHTFRSGETEQGVLIQNPRMLVCPKTDLYQFDVSASVEQNTKVIVGLYNAELKKDPNIKTERLYLVFFLDATNNPLHTFPLKYAARGVNGATFEIERRAFKAELEACHAITNQVSAKPKNDLFHSLGVFCFTTIAELAGDRQKHWCCKVVAHEKPTTENWKNYFVGYTQFKNYAWSALEPGQRIDVLSAPAIAPGGDEMAALPLSDELYSADLDYQQEEIAAASLFPAPTVETSALFSYDVSRATRVNRKDDEDPEVGF